MRAPLRVSWCRIRPSTWTGSLPGSGDLARAVNVAEVETVVAADTSVEVVLAG